MNLSQLVYNIFLYNVLTFGAGPNMIPLLQKNFVDQMRVITDAQLLYAFAVGRVTPGQANTFVASIGFMLDGLIGATLATLVIQLPGYVMLPFMKGYEIFKGSEIMAYFTRGLTAVSIGMIFASTLNIGLRTLSGWVAFGTFGIALVFIYFLKWNPILGLLGASVIGVVIQLIVGLPPTPPGG